MYLKKLSIQGFKSFANRTVFDYGPGITAVVGPNGSGKSNVADAVRWVLGEQSTRLLRARKQEDVIFSGTVERKAVGMAEVILTLDNEDRWLPLDFGEVEVGRRVYRNGESEYLLNGSRVRLRDVIDLLMQGDVGQNSYTIMGQGLVDEVLTMGADERRNFLDEAADVKRFRHKVKEANDRLFATRGNIERVELVISEIEPRLAQLRRQAERAAEHRKLQAELIDLLRAYYGHRWSEAHNQIVRARAALDQRTAENAEASRRVDSLREQIRALSDEIRKRREAISRQDSRQTALDQRFTTTEQSITLDRERHAMLAARSRELDEEIQSLEAERMALATTDVDEGRRGIEVTEEVEASRVRVRQSREALEHAEREYAGVRSRVQELRDTAAADERRAGGMEADAAAAQRHIENLEREHLQTVSRRKQVLVELIGFGRRYLDVRVALSEAETHVASARSAALTARDRLARVQDEVRSYETARHEDTRALDHLEGRLEALLRVQAEHDGVAAGTRNVLIMGQALIEGVTPGSLGEPVELHGVTGLLARQIKVPAGLEAAINAALEQRLHAIIVDRDEEALKAIELLQRRRHGRAQFLSLESVRHVYPLNLNREKGVLGVAAKLVRCESKVRPLIDTLLGRVIVCEDVTTAMRMSKRALGSVVTLDGTYIEPNGVISGGASGSEEGPFLRQREIEELPEQIAELRARTNVSQQQLDQARNAVEHATRSARDSEAAFDAVRRDVDGARLQLERERDRLHRHRRDMDGVHGRQADIARDRDAKERLIAQATQATAQLQSRREERRGAIAELEQELEAATTRREAAFQAVSEASSRMATIEGERKTLIAMREQHEKAIERLSSQAQARKLQARNLGLEASVVDERIAKFQQQLETIALERSSQTDDAAPDRDELHRLESHERSVQDEYNDAHAALLRIERSKLDLEAEVSRLTEQIETFRIEMEREGLAPDRTGRVVAAEEAMSTDPLFAEAEPVVQGGADLDVQATRNRIEEIRRHIRRLGPINAEAPDDYAENEERFTFLTTQIHDLAEAEIQLREVIGELNEEIKTRFGATFEVVNKAFGEYFSAFFGGGAASLMMTSPDNVAETGIDIEAQPPGKKVKTLSLLSGGERSLTAVALLFALLSANPAPFCVLDEVDAALDEANVGRFTDALNRLAEKTQFLMVTHNRRSVEVANSIYGVSMARDGISKVISMRLADVPQN